MKYIKFRGPWANAFLSAGYSVEWTDDTDALYQWGMFDIRTITMRTKHEPRLDTPRRKTPQWAIDLALKVCARRMTNETD